jgi:hypothetical protein
VPLGRGDAAPPLFLSSDGERSACSRSIPRTRACPPGPDLADRARQERRAGVLPCAGARRAAQFWGAGAFDRRPCASLSLPSLCPSRGGGGRFASPVTPHAVLSWSVAWLARPGRASPDWSRKDSAGARWKHAPPPPRACSPLSLTRPSAPRISSPPPDPPQQEPPPVLPLQGKEKKTQHVCAPLPLRERGRGRRARRRPDLLHPLLHRGLARGEARGPRLRLPPGRRGRPYRCRAHREGGTILPQVLPGLRGRRRALLRGHAHSRHPPRRREMQHAGMEWGGKGGGGGGGPGGVCVREAVWGGAEEARA